MTGAGINTYTVECDRPQNGWDSTQILLRVTDNSGTQPACTTQVHVATVSVASVPTLTIAASQTAPALICWGAQEAKATFDVTADSTVDLQYEVETGCQRTITGTFQIGPAENSSNHAASHCSGCNENIFSHQACTPECMNLPALWHL